MRRTVISILALVLVVAAGCRKGPGEEAVAARIQASLDEQLGEGTLRVEDLERRGSQPYTMDGDDRDRLVTYYDATLIFGEDYNFVGWEEPNVGSLTTILGATVRGVEGVASGGNRAGDHLEVHGAVAWVRGEDGWEQAAFAPEVEGGETHPDSEEPEPYRRTLEELGAVGARLVKRAGPSGAMLLHRDLVRVRTRHEMMAVGLDGVLTIATADPAGSYHPLGVRLADALTAAGIPAQAFPTSGSEENVDLLTPRCADFAIIQSDVAELACSDRCGAVAAEGDCALRALGALFPEAVHVVVRADSGLHGIEDLAGRRVAVGMQGSGSTLDARRILRAAGMNPMMDVEATYPASLSAAVAGLLSGEVDAMFVTTAYPSPLLRRAAASRDLRFIPLSPSQVREVRSLASAMVSVRIPAGTYSGQDQPVATVGVTALLVARTTTPEDWVRRAVDLVWGSEAALVGAGTAGSMVSTGRRTLGVTIPFHSGALP